MRKGFLVCLALFFIFPVYSQNIPEPLYGIWEGKDRFVFFEQEPESRNPELVLLLKDYYGFHIDRTAEPRAFASKEPRVRNAGTSKDSVIVTFDILDGIQTKNSWEGLVQLDFSKRQENLTPVCVIDGKMYLNYYIQDSENPQLYKGGVVSRGITINEQIIPENITCFIIDGDKMYDIRYWKSTMDYTSEKALVSYNGDSYYVPKHIVSGKTVYSCVSGRSKKVRNVQPPKVFNKDDYIWNDDSTLLVIDKEPYLYQLIDKTSFDDLMEIVRKQNNSRRPPRPDPFPPSDLDWHWDIIDYLEQYDKLVQEVRQRQRDFGPRAKDLAN